MYYSESILPYSIILKIVISKRTVNVHNTLLIKRTKLQNHTQLCSPILPFNKLHVSMKKRLEGLDLKMLAVVISKWGSK